MEGNIVNIVDEKFVLKRAEIMLKHMRVIKIYRVLAAIVGFFGLYSLYRIFRELHRYGDLSMMECYWLIMECALIWIFLRCPSWGYMQRVKKGMKNRIFPCEQLVVFDDEGIEVSNWDYTQKFSWSILSCVCESHRYWYFGINGIAVDKNQLDKEQYEFIEGKSDEILSKTKWIG